MRVITLALAAVATEAASIPDGPGVYVITQPDSTAIYVGQSLRLRQRLRDHARASSRFMARGEALNVTILSLPNAVREEIGIVELALISAAGRESNATGPLLNVDAFEVFAGDKKARTASARKAVATRRRRLARAVT